MIKIDAFSNEYTEALAELTGYIAESEKKEPEKKTRKIFGFREKQPVPRKEAASEENPEDNGEESGAAKDEDIHTGNSLQDEIQEDESLGEEEREEPETQKKTAPKEPDDYLVDDDGIGGTENPDLQKKEIVKSDFGRNKVGTHVEPRPRYIDAKDLVATVSVKCAREAVKAMRALREIKSNNRPYVLVMVRDDGERSMESFRTKEAAIMSMHRAMDFYVNEIEPKDYSKIVYMDTGDNERIYEPTPVNEIAEDGTIKRESEINGTLRRIETEDRGIIYFEEKNATARWDIYNLANAVPGDADDPAYEQFKEEMAEVAREQEAETKQEEKKKRKWFF